MLRSISLQQLSSFTFPAWIVGLCLASAVPVQAASSSSEFDLYRVHGEKVFTASPNDEAVTRRQPVLVLRDRLVSLEDASGQALEKADVRIALPLFDGSQVHFSVDSIQETGHGFTLVADGGQGVLVWDDEGLAGSIRSPDGGSYRLITDGEGTFLEEIDLSAYPEHPEDGIRVEPGSADSFPTPLAGAKDSGNEIDLMVLYTGVVRASQGGAGNIRRLIQLGVSETNTAMSRSAVGTRLKLVHMQEVGYSEAGDIRAHLRHLTDPNDGILDQIHQLRDQYGADLVKLVGADTEGGCGVAYVLTSPSDRSFERLAFSYTAARCISPNYTFAHELGHNMGSLHAPDDPVGNRGAYPFSFGYKDPANAFRTIMAYNCDSGCPRQLHWSNPRRSLQGRPLGLDTQDNARSLRGVLGLVANFRQSQGSGDRGALGWTLTEPQVAEYESNLRLTVPRSRGTFGAVRVDWRLESDTAQVGIDIADVSGTLSWAAGEGGSKAVDIPILNDRLIEGDETFRVVLFNVQGGALLERQVATVTLSDNDVEPFQCTADAQNLCLGRNNRFQVSAVWRAGEGQEGPAQTVNGADAGGDSGLMWFFQADNWELLLKVLDGCSINNRFWVLFAATTDVGFDLKVTDSQRGEFKIYRNAEGTASPLVNDTEAFDCS